MVEEKKKTNTVQKTRADIKRTLKTNDINVTFKIKVNTTTF